MKALTLTQPWATLVAIGAKKIETRSWSTNYRGPLAIHAAKNFPISAWDLCHNAPIFFDALFPVIGRVQRDDEGFKDAELLTEDLPLGCVIATCELIGVDQFGGWIDWPDKQPIRWQKPGNPLYTLTDQERAFGDYTVGRYGWFLTNVKQLPAPIPAKGALGLWDWEPPS